MLREAHRGCRQQPHGLEGCDGLPPAHRARGLGKGQRRRARRDREQRPSRKARMQGEKGAAASGGGEGPSLGSSLR